MGGPSARRLDSSNQVVLDGLCCSLAEALSWLHTVCSPEPPHLTCICELNEKELLVPCPFYRGENRLSMGRAPRTCVALERGRAGVGF